LSFELKPIRIEFVPQHRQRYASVGDYWEKENEYVFSITEFPDNPEYSVAILQHELHEFFRNKQLGIKIEDVDKFDLEHPELDDPGLSKEAPYHKTHMESDAIERLSIIFSGGDWVDYETAIDRLFEKEPK
jgi:hypothetical protein